MSKGKNKNKDQKKKPQDTQPQEQTQETRIGVVASVQLFDQVPPQQVYVLTDGSTIASPHTEPALVNRLRDTIMNALIASTPSADEAEVLDQLPTPAEDVDGLSPEDYAALEGSWENGQTTEDREPLTVEVPEGMDRDTLAAAIAAAIDAAPQKGLNS